MKDGKKTTEFYLSLVATILGAVLAALGAVFPELTSDPEEVPEWVRIVSILGGSIMSALGTLGYAASRSKVKAAEQAKEGEIEKAKVESKGLVDAAKARNGSSGFANVWLLVGSVLLALVLLAGCSTPELKKYDPETVRQIDITIEYEKDRQVWVEDRLSDSDEFEFDTVSDAEISRLEQWKISEESKKLGE